jgi:UDP-N-acetylmuramate dehydrogenase
MTGIENNVSLRAYTTLKTGGVARYMFTVRSVEDVRAAVHYAKQNGLPYFILGRGSNVLAADEGFSGVVIKIELQGISYEALEGGVVRLKAAAGELLDAVIADTVKRGYWGLENLSSIPGTVGATPVQNVGAYGVEVKDLIESVEVFHIPTETIQKLTNALCAFGYRDSIFKRTGGGEYIITAVNFLVSVSPLPKLSYRDLALYFGDVTPSLSEIRIAIEKIRADKFPNWEEVGTAGSFFKNPIIDEEKAKRLKEDYPDLPVYQADAGLVKVSLGYVLDKVCQMKGHKKGKVGLYEKQALVLINEGVVSTEEILNFASEVATRVKEVTGIEIEMEVRLLK